MTELINIAFLKAVLSKCGVEVHIRKQDKKDKTVAASLPSDHLGHHGLCHSDIGSAKFDTAT